MHVCMYIYIYMYLIFMKQSTRHTTHDYMYTHPYMHTYNTFIHVWHACAVIHMYTNNGSLLPERVIYANIHAHICMYVYTFADTHMHVVTWVHTYVHTQIHMHVKCLRLIFQVRICHLFDIRTHMHTYMHAYYMAYTSNLL